MLAPEPPARLWSACVWARRLSTRCFGLASCFSISLITALRVASIKKDTEEKNSFGRVRRGSAGLNKLAKELDGGAAVCSGPRSGLRSLRRLMQ